MKLIKSIAIVALLFAANTLSAQSAASKWPAMKTYEEVITRINNGVEQGNQHVITGFTNTLNYASGRLTTDVPAEFKSNAKLMTAVAKMQSQTQKLNDLVASKAPDATLKPVFLETYGMFQEVLGHMTSKK